MVAKQKPIEIFTPPNILKAKVGGSGVGLDSAALKRAEAAMESLKGEFMGWMLADVDRLCEARAAFAEAGDAESRDVFYRSAHDLKGQALTFEHPMVSRVAASLCKLMDTPSEPPALLIDAHVNAIRVLVRQDIRDDADETACALAAELEARVSEVAA